MDVISGAGTLRISKLHKSLLQIWGCSCGGIVVLFFFMVAISSVMLHTRDFDGKQELHLGDRFQVLNGSNLRRSVVAKLNPPARHASDMVRQPRFYVYMDATNQGARLISYLATRSDAELLEWAWGHRLINSEGETTQYYDTENWAVSKILLYRLFRQHEERRTSNPEDADLFLIPLVPSSPVYYNRKLPVTYGIRQAVCHHIFYDNLETIYPYLNTETARQHMFAVPSYSALLTMCVIAVPELRNVSPVSRDLLIRFRYVIGEEQSIASSAKSRQPRVSPDAKRLAGA